MPLLARTVLAPLTVEVHDGAVTHLAGLLADHRISTGGQVAVVVGPGLGEQISGTVTEQLPDAVLLSVDGGTHAAAMDLADRLRGRDFDAIVGIGGGKVIDTVKFAASQLGLPMVAVATNLAHDGIASPVSSLERDGKSISYGVHTPLAVIVDLDFVARSPAGQVRSGIGDAVSNLSAADDWQLSHAETGEPVDGLALALARSGAEAVLRHPGDIGDKGFLATLANALLLGGVAMAMAGSSRPCSGGCHEIAHAITQLHPGLSTHGEQAGMGALWCTYLRGDKTLFAELSAALRRHGLPRTPADLGLTDEQFADAVAFAPSTRPGRYTILEHLGLDKPGIRNRIAEYLNDLDEPDGE